MTRIKNEWHEFCFSFFVIPAKAGIHSFFCFYGQLITDYFSFLVIPAKAGIHVFLFTDN